MDNSSLEHTKWNCKYHIVFAPKYRRQVIYGKIKVDIEKNMRTQGSRNNRSEHVQRSYTHASSETN